MFAYCDVKTGPNFYELIKVIILQKGTHCIISRCKTFQNDGNEKVKKN